MNAKITQYLEQVSSNLQSISKDRIEILQQIVKYIQSTPNPKLNFICTHNSRRSHLSQIWAQTMAHRFKIPLETFSGGTEATAFNPNAVAALTRAGFDIKKDGVKNPYYQVSFSSDENPLVAFSKKFEDSPNPTSGFAAIMTCSEADAECPIVFGADKQIKLFYEDPKVADDTPEEASTYDKRCKQIATEMYYVFYELFSQKKN